jgi:hypothetical protein
VFLHAAMFVAHWSGTPSSVQYTLLLLPLVLLPLLLPLPLSRAKSFTQFTTRRLASLMALSTTPRYSKAWSDKIQ